MSENNISYINYEATGANIKALMDSKKELREERDEGYPNGLRIW